MSMHRMLTYRGGMEGYNKNIILKKCYSKNAQTNVLLKKSRLKIAFVGM